MQGQVYEAALNGKDLKWIKEYWWEVFDPTGQYEEPSNKSKSQWMKGNHVAQSEKNKVLYGQLAARYEVPRDITRRMLDATQEGPRLPEGAPYEQRRAMQEDEYR